ncbi:hypothetical protein Tco_1052881 [Tanacetum coccineum]
MNQFMQSFAMSFIRLMNLPKFVLTVNYNPRRSSSLDLVDVLTVSPCWNLLEGWDYIRRLNLMRKVLMFTFKETPKRICKYGLVDCKVDEEKRSWNSKRKSNLIDLDTTTLRDLIDSKGRLIPEDPQLGVPRVGVPRPLRASMQDLYDRMGVFEHMAGVYSVPLQGAYNPPGYAPP